MRRSEQVMVGFRMYSQAYESELKSGRPRDRSAVLLARQGMACSEAGSDSVEVFRRDYTREETPSRVKGHEHRTEDAFGGGVFKG